MATQEISERSDGEEAIAANLTPDETFDLVRGGARLVLNYDAAGNAFAGTVENTTSNVLTNVRIDMHLSNGTEQGLTTPVDLAPGQVIEVNRPSTAASFTGAGNEAASIARQYQQFQYVRMEYGTGYDELADSKLNLQSKLNELWGELDALLATGPAVGGHQARRKHIQCVDQRKLPGVGRQQT